MSRVGKRPIDIPAGVKVELAPSAVHVQGPKGTLELDIPSGIKLELKDNKVLVSRESDLKDCLMKHGLIRALINNMVKGVTEEFFKELEIIGVGFKAQVSGSRLTLSLGFSHPIEYEIPQGIKIEASKPTHLKVTGADKQQVGEVAAEIRAFYKPEPYKGKGIRYVGEYVRKKAGKTVA